MPSQITPEQIEAYYFGTLPEADRVSFEQQLQEDDQIRQEVATYLQILDGFMAKKSQSFLQQMQGWEQDNQHQEQDELALIESYLEQSLHPSNQERVEERMKKDPGFAAKVKQYSQLLDGFSAKRSNTFKDKLQSWEQDSPVRELPRSKSKVRPLTRWLAIAASFLVVLSLGLNWYASSNYSSAALANASYQKPLSNKTMGNKSEDKSAWLNRFTEAQNQFQNNDYFKARSTFQALLAEISELELDAYTEKLYQDQLDWYVTLSWLGMNERDKALNRVQLIAQNTEHDYQSHAQELLQKIDSFWYRLAN